MKIEELDSEEYEDERIDPIRITIETKKEAGLFMLLFGYRGTVSQCLGDYLKLDFEDVKSTMDKMELYQVLRKVFPDMTEKDYFKKVKKEVEEK